VKVIVLYASKGGNTRKIAQAVASEIDCEALDVAADSGLSALDLDNFDLVFLGTGIYTGNPIAEMEQYIQAADLGKSKRFALFITWGGAGKTRQMVADKLRKMLEDKGQQVAENMFSCYGGSKFSFLKRGHPNSEDIQAAKHWANELVRGWQDASV
jgi:flavodoxin